MCANEYVIYKRLRCTWYLENSWIDSCIEYSRRTYHCWPYLRAIQSNKRKRIHPTTLLHYTFEYFDYKIPLRIIKRDTSLKKNIYTTVKPTQANLNIWNKFKMKLSILLNQTQLNEQ